MEEIFVTNFYVVLDFQQGLKFWNVTSYIKILMLCLSEIYLDFTISHQYENLYSRVVNKLKLEPLTMIK